MRTADDPRARCMDAATPAISVAMIAYQQEAFIAQAIDSVLMQQVDRPFELVIGDDGSTDGTRAMLTACAARHRDTIRLLPDRGRLGAQRNFVRTLQACRGRYIALLEADDFWTARHKLQRQADYLDQHPECAICFHNVTVLLPGRTELFNAPDQKRVSTLEDLIDHNFMATCSVMYRARLFPEFPDWFDTLPCGDWPLHVLNAEHGAIGYLDEVMGAYRKHGTGLWSGLSATERLEMRLACYPTLLAHVGGRHGRAIRGIISDLHNRLARRYAAQGQFATAVRHAVDSIRVAPLHRRAWVKPFGRFLLRRLRERRLDTSTT